MLNFTGRNHATTLTAALILSLLPTLATAHGPSRQKITRDVVIAAPAARVWSVISEFCAIEQWHPAVAACSSEGGNEPGAVRVLSIGATDGPQITEELLKYDADAMSYKYKIAKTDNAVLPVTTYSATLKVADNGDGTSTLTWKGGFYRAYPNNNPPPELNDEAAVTAVTGVYDSGVASIKAIAEANGQ